MCNEFDGLVERLRNLAVQSNDGNLRGPALEAATAIQTLTTRLAESEARERDLRDALAPFVDLHAQNGAWGIISKKLGGMAPLTVTVTKAQMQAAFTALNPENTTNG